MTSEEPSSGYRLGYVTDVEGNFDFFKSFVARSNVLFFSSEELVLRDDCYFVYGGDSVDKGPGDIRLCRALVSLKKKHPDRVFLLVGNRDLNKLRLTSELSTADMARKIDEIPPPHWDPKALTLRQHLEGVVDKSNGSLSSEEEANTRIERLNYMLQRTLGCPDTFEFRRQELAIIDGCSASEVSDDAVLESFLHEVEHPDGSLRQYLENANVAVVIGNTLFAHGAVDKNTIRFVPRLDSRFENPPERPAPGQMCDTVDEWVAGLNDYLKQGLLDYHKRPLWDKDRTTRGGESLMALQNRAAMWGRSIISNCYGDGGCITTDAALEYRKDPNRAVLEETDPLSFEAVSSDPMDATVAEWLLQGGIRRVVVGHKPTGDAPAVLSATYTGVEMVSADTSYSDIKANDNRGVAVPVVELVGDSVFDNHLEIWGSLQDSMEYHNVFHRIHEDGVDVTVGDENLGRRLSDAYWVKATTNQQQYQLCRGSGRNVEYKYVPVADVSLLETNCAEAGSL